MVAFCCQHDCPNKPVVVPCLDIDRLVIMSCSCTPYFATPFNWADMLMHPCRAHAAAVAAKYMQMPGGKFKPYQGQRTQGFANQQKVAFQLSNQNKLAPATAAAMAAKPAYLKVGSCFVRRLQHTCILHSALASCNASCAHTWSCCLFGLARSCEPAAAVTAADACLSKSCDWFYATTEAYQTATPAQNH